MGLFLVHAYPGGVKPRDLDQIVVLGPVLVAFGRLTCLTLESVVITLASVSQLQ